MDKLAEMTFVLAVSAALSGCMSPGMPASRGTTYECSGGTRLQISYLRNGALVGVNGARPLPFSRTPSNGGQVFENGGSRVARQGNNVSWNTAARSAPEECRPVITTN
jgi:hypothetical protein